MNSRIPIWISVILSLKRSLMSVATWSFLDLAVCMNPASGIGGTSLVAQW